MEIGRFQPVVRCIAKAALLLAVSLLCCELPWRMLGYQPTCRNTGALWASIRRQADQGPSEVALLGSSRFQIGVDPEQMERMLPQYHFRQLSVDGSNPLTALHDLSEDERFRGVTIVELPTYWPFTPFEPGNELVDDFLRVYHEDRIGIRVENWLQVHLEGYFAFFRPEARFWLAAAQLAREHSLPPPGSAMDSRRRAWRSFAHVDQAAAEERWVRDFTSLKERFGPRETPVTRQLIARWSERIRSRGGKVIFFRMIVTGRLWALEEKSWPRDRYWDVFASSQTAAVLSFTDYPEFAGYHCPDGSHLDVTDVARFTTSFTQLLRRKGLL